MGYIFAIYRNRKTLRQPVLYCRQTTRQATLAGQLTPVRREGKPDTPNPPSVEGRRAATAPDDLARGIAEFPGITSGIVNEGVLPMPLPPLEAVVVVVDTRPFESSDDEEECGMPCLVGPAPLPRPPSSTPPPARESPLPKSPTPPPPPLV